MSLLKVKSMGSDVGKSLTPNCRAISLNLNQIFPVFCRTFIFIFHCKQQLTGTCTFLHLNVPAQVSSKYHLQGSCRTRVVLGGPRLNCTVHRFLMSNVHISENKQGICFRLGVYTVCVHVPAFEIVRHKKNKMVSFLDVKLLLSKLYMSSCSGIVIYSTEVSVSPLRIELHFQDSHKHRDKCVF